jgi:hypothetical protein
LKVPFAHFGTLLAPFSLFLLLFGFILASKILNLNTGSVHLGPFWLTFQCFCGGSLSRVGALLVPFCDLPSRSFVLVFNFFLICCLLLSRS